MGGLDPGGMAPENGSKLHAQAVWGFEFLAFHSRFWGTCESRELTRHGADTPEPTVVAHDGGITFNLAIDG